MNSVCMYVMLFLSNSRHDGSRNRGGRAYRLNTSALTTLKEQFPNFRQSLVGSPCPGSPRLARCLGTPSSTATFSLFEAETWALLFFVRLNY